MTRSIGTALVSEVARTQVITVEPTTKLDKVAVLFEENDINAAPVVDGLGKCIGIITSRDLVRFEAIRSSLESQFRHGIAFDVDQNDLNSAIGIFGRPFDEVAYHMSSDIITIDDNSTLSRASRIMCRNHIHHLLVLDAAERPIGILSSLDILGEVVGEVIASNTYQRPA